MARPLQIQIVERARALIADQEHWCRGHLALDACGVSILPSADIAVRRGALGALITAAYELTRDRDAAHDLAHRALHPHCGMATLIHINDMRGHADVLEVFDYVISAA
jgi:hypothetical protein